MEIKTTKEIFDECITKEIISCKILSDTNKLCKTKWVRVDDVINQISWMQTINDEQLLDIALQSLKLELLRQRS